MKNVDAILTADWHIRADKPICRTDDFQEAMWAKVEFILTLAQEIECPILLAGDLGHYSQWPNWLIEKFIRLVKKYKAQLITIPGQHNLPNHNLQQYRKSAIGILSEDRTINLLGVGEEVLDWTSNNEIDGWPPIFPFPYGKQISSIDAMPPDADSVWIAIAHQMVIENKPYWPGQKDPKAHDLLKKFPEYKLILTGDNHIPFVAEYKGRLLVNPGSMMRTTAAQIDHKPRVYLWDAEDNKVEPVFLPIEEDVISREHIDTKIEIDEGIALYVSRLKLQFEIGLDFEYNLEELFKATRTRKQVKDRVWEACEK